jgi:hypothetical protein
MKNNMTRILALLLLLPLQGIGKENVIQCANLIYAGNQTSRCFSDQFLTSVQKDTGIATE